MCFRNFVVKFDRFMYDIKVSDKVVDTGLWGRIDKEDVIDVSTVKQTVVKDIRVDKVFFKVAHKNGSI